MESNSLPPAIEEFVRSSIRSVCHMDCLVRLARMDGAPIGADDLAVVMAQKPEIIRAVLDELHASGFLTREGGMYALAPNSEELAGQVRSLVEAYDRFPVQLIRIIYEPRVDPPKNSAAQSFADAFRLRKD
jgi:hypothetical protein